jgi:hypothetical protein
MFYSTHLSSVTQQKKLLDTTLKNQQVQIIMNSYAYYLNSLILFIDIMEYKEDRAFSPEPKVTNIYVYWYLAIKAYSTLESGGNDLPDRCCSTTIKYHDKAISHFMP